MFSPLRHTYVLLECHPVVSRVTHKAGGLVELVTTNLALVLTPVQFVMFHVSDHCLQDLSWLRLVLEPEVDDKVAILLENFSTELTVKSCAESELSKLAPSRFFVFLILLVFQNV